MKFTDKFTYITTSVVLMCIALVLVGGLFTLRSLSLKYHQQRMDAIINVIERQLDKGIEKHEFEVWLPDLLNASGVVRLQIKRSGKVLYQSYYESRHYYPKNRQLSYQYQLEKYPKISLHLDTRQPYDEIKFSMKPLAGISLAVLFSLTLLIFAIRWIKKQFKGAELLERRAKYLLQNNPTARIPYEGEWPKLASKALDVLTMELEQSKKERSYFDAHIRGQAFLDESTGLGNNLAFENRLDVVAMEQNVYSSALLLIKFSELDTLNHQLGTNTYQKMLMQITELLSAFVQRYDDRFHGRIDVSEFVIIIPQMSYQETEVAAKQLCKLLFQLQLPQPFVIDEFFHIGVVNFHYGAKTVSIMDDLNQALLVAVHQKSSGWFLADQQEKPVSLAKGTVRWRTLLENRLENNGLLLYSQKVVLADGIDELYCELLPRIKDSNQEIIAAAAFLPMAEKCGLHEKFDLQMLEKTLALLVSRGQSAIPVALNLSARILTDKSTHKWLMYELMQQPKYLRNNLVIEVSEDALTQNYFSLRTALNAVQKIGCKVAVDNVGKSIVNTEYILDFNIDYLKLHPGLVRDVNQRAANQIALQSLMASCLNSRTKIIAVGIENSDEWDCLLKLGIYAGQGHYFAAAQPTGF
ncbi:EAL domain-containing protein [Psychromonas ossibalaenae]|uniref:EAL domain-containing protein n=1 Tax=Psychromonas ossibalaenae TaxID=444922 RepID=UPI00036363B6|nr:EAL domain-containing protein [Psychromonas ossibalaenae]